MVEHVRELMKLSTIKKLDMNYVGFFCCTLGLMDMLESHQMAVVLSGLATLHKPIRKTIAEHLVRTYDTSAQLMKVLEMLREFITLSTLEQLGRLGLDTIQLDTLQLRSRQWTSFLTECRRPMKGALELIA
ncbi:hypothetical protein Pmar_PMAR026837, partial [Perkinsus marinus ATCC 50983]